MTARDIIARAAPLTEIKKAASGTAELPELNTNMHVHLPPNFSAFTSISQVTETAATEGLSALGVTNYYYHDVYEDYAAMARKSGIFPLFGLEIIAQDDKLRKQGIKINDPGNPGRMYFCGKGISRFSDPPAAAEEILEFIRQSDRERMAEMVSLITEIFKKGGVDTGLDVPQIISDIAARCNGTPDTIILQERHIAMAFQEKLFLMVPETDREEVLTDIYQTSPKAAVSDAVKTQGEIRSMLMKAGKPAFVTEKFVNFQQAFDLILGLGGVPCYPTLADGAGEICPYEKDLTELVRKIKENNIHMAELIPVRNQPDVLAEFVRTMRREGLAVVGGTEHNTLDLIPLTLTCTDGQEIPADVIDIFVEGACVTAAHQYLVTQGECGFVDSKGLPNPAYSSPEDRISAFARMGAEVIRRYRAGS